MILRHLRLPSPTSYTHASELQDKIVRKFLNYKADPSACTPLPDPLIITAEFQPVYTCGRREVGNVTADQKAHLTLEMPWGKADFHQALRGGQTTFHGPGQLTAYPILDLKRHGLNARCYVKTLESAVIATCAHYGIETMRTEHPGVWTDSERKICAVGVHLRRAVSSHGIGLNVSTDLRWFRRIVACGLEGKGTTSLFDRGVDGVSVSDVATVFVERMSEQLDGIDGFATIDEAEVD